MNQFIDKIIENLKREPKAKYNKDKTISVKYAFNFGNIPIKLKKDKESWLKHDPYFEDTANQITFKMIKPFLSLRTSKKAKEDLKKYFHEDPVGFVEDVLLCILRANEKNPLCPTSKKPRGKIEDISLQEMQKRRTTAKHLYLYLQKWLFEEDPPLELQRCLERYQVDKAHTRKPKDATMDIIKNHFDLKKHFEEYYTDVEVFYQKWIVPPIGSLTRLKNSSYLRYIQEGKSPFLIPILKPEP